MIKVNIDLNQLKNELAQIHNELFITTSGTDNERRDAVNRIIEKIRTLKNQVEDIKITIK